MFSKLYLKTSPKSFHARKFLPVETLILPLTINTGHVFKDGKTDWLIEEIVGQDTIYFHHLVPHEDNRVNLSFRRSKEKFLETNIPEPKLKTLFHCRPQDPASSLEHLLIGLHENFVVSMMAMPKVGNSLKLCRFLSGKEELDLKKAHNTLSANDLSFGFAPKAGSDPRARASLVVRCDNDHDLMRIESFLQSIDKVFPYNQDLINLVTRLFGYSKESVPHAKEKDKLVKQRKSLVIPQAIISAQYSPKIQHELGRINQQIKSVEEQSAWHDDFNFPKKKQLNLFSGFPNGIPDLQRQKQIITYHPPSINHFPERIPDVHLAILSDDLTRLQKIIKDNPCAIYERDFYGKLPIELAFDLMQPEMGAVLYDAWANLPKSEQWATQVFINRANRLSDLEFHHSYILDDELKAQHVKDYFEPLLPQLDNPLAIYKALFLTDSTLAKHVQQETEQWLLLKKLCIENKATEAKMVFAQMLPEKQAVFAAALTGSWHAIKEAISDYIPDIAALDRALSNGDKKAIDQYRKEPVLSSCNALQEAIDEAADVCEINEKIEKIIHDINALKEPLTADKNLLEEMNSQLGQLHEEKLKQLSAYEKVRKTISHSQWELKRNLSDGLAYLEWLKKRIREATKAKENHGSLEISVQLIHSELELFKAIYTAMRTGCKEQLEELIQSEFNESTGRLPTLRYKKSDAKQKDLMPKHFELYVALFNNELSAATDYIETHLKQKEEATASLGSIEAARAYFYSKTPKRPHVHDQIIKGKIPDISSYVNEKKQFETYKENIQNIFYEQCQQLKSVVNSMSQMNISFVKKIDNMHSVTHSFASILTYYANALVINNEEMQLTQSQFDKAFSSYTNSDYEKSVLLDMWQKIAAIKLSGIEQLKQCTDDYKKLSLCQDNDAFSVYTLTLIFQQASICYHKIFNIERPQQFVLALTYLIERTIQEKSWNQKAKYIALKHCCHVGGYFDRLLDSIIKSNLLSYESQDPWGYTPLLLAAVNNHVDLVTLFFDNELESSWMMSLARSDFLYYTLLSHATSREMAGLLLRRYTDPNTTFAFQVGLERKLPVLLMYHHNLTDTHGQSLLDYIASGHPYDLSHLDAILMELMEKDTAVQEGPYDETMPKAVQLAFTRHNERLLKKAKQLESRPKIKSIGTFFPSSDIKTTFRMNVEDKFEAYFSVLKKATELSLSEKEQVAILFAADFKHPKDSKATDATINFFKEKVLSNKNYIFELYYQEGRAEAIGFFCFLTKLESHPEFGTSLFVYLSLAGCAFEFANKGLLSASFKVVLALKQCSEDLGVPLKCYGRFGRPGIAYLMLPPEAISYPKYHFKKEYIHYVGSLFGNLIEENGSSIPPVYSNATVKSLNNRLYEFEYLLNEVLKADEKASLPVTFTVDEKLAQSWYKKLTESTGITQHQIHSFYKQIKPLIIDEAMIKTNSLNTI